MYLFSSYVVKSMTISIIRIFAMISTHFAWNDIFCLYLVFSLLLLNTLKMHGYCKPAANIIPIEVQIEYVYAWNRKNSMTTAKNMTTITAVTFLYWLCSSELNTLFSLSIGLRQTRLTDAPRVGNIMPHPHRTWNDDIMHRSNNRHDPIRHDHECLAWYPPLNLRIIINGMIIMILCLTQPITTPNPMARNNGDKVKKILYTA